MKRALNAARLQHLMGSIKRSTFLSTRASRKRTQLSNRSSRMGALCAGIILGVMLTALTLSLSSQNGFDLGSSVGAATESIATVAADYTTPKTLWNLGETAHAKIDFAPLATPPQAFLRRVIWVAPDGSVAQTRPITSDPATDDYSIPSSLTDQFAQVGLWTVKTIDNRGVGRVAANFTVLSSTAANADLSIAKSGPAQVSAGGTVTYTLTVTNNGPDSATDVQIKDEVPSNTTFLSAEQDSGPIFTCTTEPNEDGVEITTCTISSLDANETATFSLVYNVAANTPNGTIIFNGAKVSSSTNEVNSSDNAAGTTTNVVATPAPSVCTINCPTDIAVNNAPDLCTAVVNYSTPTASGNCADEHGQTPPVVCSPPSGSTFPVGNTTVTCASGGNSCSFVVTVHDTRPASTPTINCPADVTVSEDSEGSGSAIVNYAAPTTTGNCVTMACEPPAGSSFNVGTTTVTCTATDSSNNVATCSFTVMVTSGATCTITCSGDITATAASGQCDAVVSYSAPTTSGNCGAVTCTPASGSTFPVGTTTVGCTSSQGSGCDFTVTVIAPAAPTITTCASNKSVPADANCEGVIPNLLGEVVATGCNVVKSQSPAAGSVVAAGVYTVLITAENSAGEATCTVTVRVDSQPPVITCPANISATAAIGQVSTEVTFVATATDNCSTPSVVCVPPSGSIFQLGVTTVSCTATDGFGNQSTCSFNVAVSGTLFANADSFLRNGADNTNEGGNNLLRIQSSGHNRVLARFNLSGISTTGLNSATLTLNITENSDNWGTTGRLVDAHRLLADWTEGNGHTVGSQPNDRGTGEGVTWKCAKDTNISNQNDDCTTPWNGGTFAQATAAPVLHINDQLGDYSWNVTADVVAGASNGWVVKKRDEGQNGQVRYFSKEGAAASGNPNVGPRLVLVYQP